MFSTRVWTGARSTMFGVTADTRTGKGSNELAAPPAAPMPTEAPAPALPWHAPSASKLQQGPLRGQSRPQLPPEAELRTHEQLVSSAQGQSVTFQRWVRWPEPV